MIILLSGIFILSSSVIILLIGTNIMLSGMILMLSSMNIMCVFAAAEVKEMMNSNTLQITTQAVVGASMLRDVQGIPPAGTHPV
jgi:hypothetical protein